MNNTYDSRGTRTLTNEGEELLASLEEGFNFLRNERLTNKDSPRLTKKGRRILSNMEIEMEVEKRGY
jgi:predicted transcriptional regulator